MSRGVLVRRVCAAGIIAASALVVCVSGPAPALAVPLGVRTIASAVVSTDGTPYTFERSPKHSVTVRANASTGGDEREFFWTSDRQTLNSESCAEWTSGEGFAQQGAVFRVTESGGTVRGLTITRNVYGYAFWDFNFHEWDTVWHKPYRMLHQTDLSGYLAAKPIYPLYFCGRVRGDVMQFIVWKPGSHRPAWGSVRRGGEITIPRCAFRTETGTTGWYAGHVPASTSTVFTRAVVRYPLAGSSS